MRNLTELSLRHRSLVWYFIIVFAVGGVFAYRSLGRMEDPAFTIRQMVVSAAWPGATAEEMQEQVTDKLERRFQDVPGMKQIKSDAPRADRHLSGAAPRGGQGTDSPDVARRA